MFLICPNLSKGDRWRDTQKLTCKEANGPESWV